MKANIEFTHEDQILIYLCIDARRSVLSQAAAWNRTHWRDAEDGWKERMEQELEKLKQLEAKFQSELNQYGKQ